MLGIQRQSVLSRRIPVHSSHLKMHRGTYLYRHQSVAPFFLLASAVRSALRLGGTHVFFSVTCLLSLLYSADTRTTVALYDVLILAPVLHATLIQARQRFRVMICCCTTALAPIPVRVKAGEVSRPVMLRSPWRGRLT